VAVIIVNHPGADDGPGDAVQTAMVNWLYSR